MKPHFFVIVSYILLPVLVKAQTSSYIFKLGSDTVGYEQYTRSKNGIEGSVLILSPRAVVIDFNANFESNGNIKYFKSASYAPAKPQEIFIERVLKIQDTI